MRPELAYTCAIDADANGTVLTDEYTSVSLFPRSFSMIGRIVPAWQEERAAAGGGRDAGRERRVEAKEPGEGEKGGRKARREDKRLKDKSEKNAKQEKQHAHRYADTKNMESVCLGVASTRLVHTDFSEICTLCPKGSFGNHVRTTSWTAFKRAVRPKTFESCCPANGQ